MLSSSIGLKSSVWAPNAKQVSIVGDFNDWKPTPMERIGDHWQLDVPEAKEGDRYKFEIVTASGEVIQKADPRAIYAEVRPGNASTLFDVDSYHWTDQEWMANRKKDGASPLNIYEVHLGSWKHPFLNYRDFAHELASYCKGMGFTHVELLPVMEHPLDESWGYQVTGFFAPTSRFGTPADFQYMVDYLHQESIGVILDWVPGHFPTDEWGLANFDGTPLYEQEGIHPHWTTAQFDFSKPEVCDFLVDSALYWFEKMHIDGLRVDGVTSMIELDYGRDEGEWTPNIHGGNENLDAVAFLKRLNAAIHEKFPHVLMIAEESSAFPGVSDSIEEGGLGFDMKWNMGWMNDTLAYFSKDHHVRADHHDHLTWGLTYAFSERHMLILSHDEVVHLKKSLLSKMPGNEWEKFAGLRLLHSYTICQPGKQLLFMGGEFGQWEEWDCKSGLDWHLAEEPHHQGVQKMVRDLNHFYLEQAALWECDFEQEGFEWIDHKDTENSVISYRRKGKNSELICIHNFLPNAHASYTILSGQTLPTKELFNTDAAQYGGSGQTNNPIEILQDDQGAPLGFKTALPPLATVIYQVD